MGQQKSTKRLAGFLAYLLGRHPDEFGLIPDKDGFFKIKDVLKALHEEEGWKHIRRQHFNEVLLTLANPPIDINDRLVRAADRGKLPVSVYAEDVPKLLYTCVRRKAYPVIAKNGLSGYSEGRVILSAQKELAEKIGRRIDAAPVLLTVHARRSAEQGIVFFQYGAALFTTRSLPPECFSGPPLPKDLKEAAKAPVKETSEVAKTPGSYLVDLSEPKVSKRSLHTGRKGKDPSWKKHRKHLNKQRNKMWPD